MSNVTNIILIMPACGDELDVKMINDKLLELDGHYTLNQVDEHAGGLKAMEVDVYMGAFNGLDVSEFKAWFNRTIFREKLIQLFIQEQDDDLFQILIRS